MTLLRALFFAAVNAALYVACCRQVKIFRMTVGYFPNIARPRRYHEKMLWRKIFDHNPLFVTFCDKLAAKEYVRQRLPNLRIPQTLWVGEDLARIPAGILGPGVLVKANHGSGFSLVCGPGGGLEPEDVARANRWLSRPYGTDSWEWGYFGVGRALFAEERIAAPAEPGLMDIHVRCADGKAIFAHVYLRNKTRDRRVSFYSPEGALLRFPHDHMNSYGGLPEGFALPGAFHEAIRLAQELSAGIDLIRVDFLTDGETLYAGEITVYPGTGATRQTPKGAPGSDILSNPHWDLRKSWFLRAPQPGWRGLYARQLGRALDQDAAAGQGNDA